MSDHDLLVRMDERTKTIMASLPTFVTKKEFAPVKAIAYGIVSIVCVAVLGAILALVIGE